jgi:hypothetical protein
MLERIANDPAVKRAVIDQAMRAVLFGRADVRPRPRDGAAFPLLRPTGADPDVRFRVRRVIA